MSTFPGRLKEYPYFSLDRFDGDNLRSKMFFLSHCHQDHMIGLDSAEFFKLLRQNNYMLYVQKVTAHLLLCDPVFVHLKPYVVPLEVNVPYPFTVATDDGVENFVVTLLSAGHCPGSVMFLIEGKEGVVLYTGDIRLTKDDLEQMPALKTCGRVKNIKSIYFDSTFCIRHTYVIPTRNESRDALIALVETWLKKNPSNKILLSCAAKYGQEYLFVELSRYFGMKVHLPESKNEIYSKIPEIAQHITPNAAETRIHACTYWLTENDNKELNKKYAMNQTCPDCRFWDKNVLTIKPSMLYFAQTKSVNKTVHVDEKGIYRIKYSSHSSLKEIREIIAYLKPERAYPNVLPYRSSYREIHEAIKDLLPQTPTKQDDFSSTSNKSNKKLLTLGKRIKLLERSSDDESDDDSSKKRKLSSPTTTHLSVETAESKWDLWNNIKLSSSSTSSTPKKHSQSQGVSLSQKSEEDMFNSGKENCSAHDDSSNDLFEEINETLLNQNESESVLSQALSDEIKFERASDLMKDELVNVENGSEKKNVTIDLVEKADDPSDYVITIDDCDSLQSTQSLRLNDSSSSIEILDDDRINISTGLKRQSSSIEIIGSVTSSDIIIMYDKNDSKKIVKNNSTVVDVDVDNDCWLNKNALKPSSTVLR